MKKKKKDDFYFKNLSVCAGLSYQAAEYLNKTLTEFDAAVLKEKLDEIHKIEQKADAKKHKMMEALSQAFITPIEREDLLALSDYMDDITDAVEDVLIQIYIGNIAQMREDILPMISLLLLCISALQDVLGELRDFKHSKKINDYIIRVNDLEEEGDRMHIDSMHRLYGETDVKTILAWQKVYTCVENCMDLCENAADVVSTVIMKNS